MIVDLSDRLAGLRAERAGETKRARFAGREWTLPAQWPIAATLYWRAYTDPEATPTQIGARLVVAIEALFGDQVDAFYALGYSGPDAQDVVNALLSDVYGSAESPGNSPGSSEPSETTPGSDASSSTSSGTGASTSAKSSRKRKSTG